MNGHVEDVERSTTLLRRGPVRAAPHILIAEQQPAIRELLCRILQLAGYRTTVCGDRQSALTWREQAMLEDDPALILLDLSLLCAGEAADFLHLLRERWQEAGHVLPQVIVLTTNTQMQAELVTGEQVLQKPFHVREMLALIRQVLPVAPPAEESSSLEAHAPSP
jgi:DNA-binding response OmpR family regulator